PRSTSRSVSTPNLRPASARIPSLKRLLMRGSTFASFLPSPAGLLQRQRRLPHRRQTFDLHTRDPFYPRIAPASRSDKPHRRPVPVSERSAGYARRQEPAARIFKIIAPPVT